MSAWSRPHILEWVLAVSRDNKRHELRTIRLDSSKCLKIYFSVTVEKRIDATHILYLTCFTRMFFTLYRSGCLDGTAFSVALQFTTIFCTSVTTSSLQEHQLFGLRCLTGNTTKRHFWMTHHSTELAWMMFSLTKRYSGDGSSMQFGKELCYFSWLLSLLTVLNN